MKSVLLFLGVVLLSARPSLATASRCTRANDGLFHRPLHLTLDSEVFTIWFDALRPHLP